MSDPSERALAEARKGSAEDRECIVDTQTWLNEARAALAPAPGGERCGAVLQNFTTESDRSCHLPRGHEGSHQTDDGVFLWSDPVQRLVAPAPGAAAPATVEPEPYDDIHGPRGEGRESD